MRKLSVAIITYNEERNIERALKSVDFADEIIVVDSFSDDMTEEICSRYSVKFSKREFKGHIDQKNHALSLAENSWVLSIDADEEVTAGLKAEIVAILKADITKDGYKMPRRAYYLGRWIKHSGWYPDYNIRLVDKSKAEWIGIDPHDKLSVAGEVGKLGGDLLHYPYNDLSHHFCTIDKYTSTAASRLYDKGRRASVIDFTIRPIFTFLKKYILKLGILDGLAGLVIAVTTAFYTFSKYLKLYTIQKEHDSDGTCFKG